MKTAQRILAVTMFAIISVASITRADNATLADLLSGSHVPLAYKIKDLDGTWRRLHVTPTDIGVYAQLMGAGGGGIYYTKGETVVLAGVTYVIAYQRPAKTMDTMALFRGGTPPEVEPLTTESSLTLSLIQLHTAGNLTDIRPFNLDQEIADQAIVRRAVEGTREGQANANSVSNLKQIGLGLAMCADDHNGKLPDLSTPQTMKKALAQYITNEKVFLHPKTGQPYQPNPSFSGKEWQGTNADSSVLVFEAGPATDGTRAVLFNDGHVQRVDQTKWLELKKTSDIP